MYARHLPSWHDGGRLCVRLSVRIHRWGGEMKFKNIFENCAKCHNLHFQNVCPFSLPHHSFTKWRMLFMGGGEKKMKMEKLNERAMRGESRGQWAIDVFSGQN